MTQAFSWWQTGAIYQVYPRSFQDSNGDGIGDLQGIRQRLDYIQSLNVEAIWLSPIFPSPMLDFGYDVSDYTDVAQIFGSLADFDELLADVHSRGMRLLLDLVPNHTSSEHEWFRESRSSPKSPKRDWYIWRDPAPDGGLPNNWLSMFGGPAWTFDEQTGQYYLHQFISAQPELNYRHPEVMPAMLDVMRFWLDRGVDGFRVDVIWLMLKDEELRDEPENPDWDGVVPNAQLNHIYTQGVPGIHGLIRKMRGVVDEYEDRVMIGEIYLPNEELVTYYGQVREDGSGDECHIPFNFQLIETAWTPTEVRRVVDAYEAALPSWAWPNWVLGNHDKHRIASRVGPSQARVAAMLLMTLRGTPTLYNGDEIGMENVPIPRELVRDPFAVSHPNIADVVGRDPARTPMQWDDSANAGFTGPSVVPWLPLSADHIEHNVAKQEGDPASMLSFVRQLMHLRRQEPALNRGSYCAVDAEHPDLFAYRRSAESDFLVVLNFGSNFSSLDLSEIAECATILVSTDPDRNGAVGLSNLEIRPDEGLVLRIQERGA